ncbi:MAG TPA: hypothetical protein VF040_13985 [Ktedonobacterales bacterium]
MAEAFACEGAHVVVSGRNEKHGQAVADAIQAAGGQAPLSLQIRHRSRGLTD